MATNFTVSISNTPQAVDDFAYITEGGDTLMNVLENDLGGNAKKLYSVNQSDLLLASAEWTLASGAIVRIVNGQIVYDLNGAFEYLGDGLTATDTFEYAIRLSNGTLSVATATVTITGVNDLASITGTSTGSVSEDGTLTTGGVLTVSDVDTGENTFGEIGTLAGQYGAFTFADGVWSYTLNNDDPIVQALSGTDVVHDTLTVKSKDGTAEQVINVTITGATDHVPLEIAYATTDRVRVLAVDLNGHMTLTGIQLPSDAFVYDVSGGDVDGDGDVDFLVSGDNGNGRLYFNNGDNTFTDSGNRFPGRFQSENELVDIDNDGDLDAAFSNGLGGSSHIYRNDGGVFTLAQDINNGLNLGFSARYIGDFGDLNADGYADLVLVGLGAKVYLNNGTGGFIDTGILSSEYLNCVDIGDIDGDGDNDLVFGSHTSIAPGNGAVFFNNGNGSFTPGQSAIGGGQSGDVELSDVDHDGDLDALFAAGANGLQLWKNDGAGVFSHAATISNDGGGSLSMFDFDTDGDQDIAVNGTSAVRTFENDGTGAFTLAHSFTVSPHLFRIDAGDWLV